MSQVLVGSPADEVMGVYEASSLHVARVKGFKRPNLKVAVNLILKEGVWKFYQRGYIAREFCVLISVATSFAGALQVCRIAENAEHVVGADAPHPQVWVTAIVDAQATANVQVRRVVASGCARTIYRRWKHRSARKQ